MNRVHHVTVLLATLGCACGSGEPPHKRPSSPATDTAMARRADSAAAAREAVRPKLARSRDEIAALFPAVSFSLTQLQTGQQSWNGRGRDGLDQLTMVEIIGPAVGPDKANVISGIANDAPASTPLALRNGLALVKVVTGERRCIDWYAAAVKKISETKQIKQCGGAWISVHILRSMGMLVTSITAARPEA